MPLFYRDTEKRMHPWPVSDLDFSTGAKIGGEISVIENAIESVKQSLGIFASGTPEAEWFDREASANIVDISKWNGDIFWPRLWERSDGCIGRLGYGAVTDQRYLNSTVPGFQIETEDPKYKGLYHYMNTGVNLQAQIDSVLKNIDILANTDDVHAFWSDIEGFYNDQTSPLYRSNPLAIMRAVRQEFPHLKVGFYTNKSSWIALGMPKEWLQEFLFWFAWYPYDSNLRFPSPPQGLTIADIYLWQYWADGNYQGSVYGADGAHMDINCSRDQLAEVLLENLPEYNEGGEIIMPDPNKELQMRNEQEILLANVKASSDKIIQIAMSIETPTPEPEPLYEAKVTSALKVRTGPGTGYPQIDTLAAGTKVSVWKEQDGSGYTWAKIESGKWVATNWLIKI